MGHSPPPRSHRRLRLRWRLPQQRPHRHRRPEHVGVEGIPDEPSNTSRDVEEPVPSVVPPHGLQGARRPPHEQGGDRKSLLGGHAGVGAGPSAAGIVGVDSAPAAAVRCKCNSFVHSPACPLAPVTVSDLAQAGCQAAAAGGRQAAAESGSADCLTD